MELKVVNYKIIEGGCEWVSEKVQKFLSEGYVLKGKLHHIKNVDTQNCRDVRYYQNLIKYESIK